MRRARRASSFISLHKKVFKSCDLNQSVNNKINGGSSNCDKGRNSQSFTVNHWLWVVWQKAGWMALNILHKDRAHQLEPCPFSLLSPPSHDKPTQTKYQESPCHLDCLARLIKCILQQTKSLKHLAEPSGLEFCVYFLLGSLRYSGLRGWSLDS